MYSMIDVRMCIYARGCVYGQGVCVCTFIAIVGIDV